MVSGVNTMNGAEPISQRSTQWHEDKARATKQAVIEGAARVFSQVGYRKAVITMISQSSGVTPGAMYHYFASKEAIALAVVDTGRDTWAKVPASAPEDSPLSVLIVKTLGQALLLDHDIVVQASFRLTFEPGAIPSSADSFSRTWLEATTDSFAAAITAGELGAEANPEQLAWNLLSGFVGTYSLIEALEGKATLLSHLEGVFSGVIRADLSAQHRDRVLTALRYSIAAAQ